MCCTCQSTKHYPVCVAAMHCHFILIFLTYYDGDDEEDIDNGDNGVCVGKPKKKQLAILIGRLMCLFIFPKFREAIIIRIMKNQLDQWIIFYLLENLKTFLNDVISKQERP